MHRSFLMAGREICVTAVSMAAWLKLRAAVEILLHLSLSNFETRPTLSLLSKLKTHQNIATSTMTDVTTPIHDLEEHDTQLEAKVAQLDINELNKLAKTLNDRLIGGFGGEFRLQGTSSGVKRWHKQLGPVFELREKLDEFIGVIHAMKKPKQAPEDEKVKNSSSKTDGITSDAVEALEKKMRDASIMQDRFKEEVIEARKAELGALRNDINRLDVRTDNNKKTPAQEIKALQKELVRIDDQFEGLVREVDGIDSGKYYQQEIRRLTVRHDHFRKSMTDRLASQDRRIEQLQRLVDARAEHQAPSAERGAGEAASTSWSPSGATYEPGGSCDLWEDDVWEDQPLGDKEWVDRSIRADDGPNEYYKGTLYGYNSW